MFALCTKTLTAQSIIDGIIENCPSLSLQEISKKALLYVLLYDEIFGEGCRVRNEVDSNEKGGGTLIRTIRESKDEIVSYLNSRMKETGVTSFQGLLPQRAEVEVKVERIVHS